MDPVDAELAKLGTLLVEERVLRRIIKGHRKIRGVGLQVPHEHCYALPRVELDKLLEKGDVAVDLATLPDRVIAISGDRTKIATGAPEVLTNVWRAIFHARVHEAFADQLARGALTLGGIRDRINRIGQAEFDEIRSVLDQEDLLLPPVDDITTYVEFVALYLELAHFAPVAVERTFPALFDVTHVDATIALDLDPAALLASSRPERAPDQPLITVAPRAGSDSGPARRERLDPSAKKPAASARKRGNRSRAALLSARAGDTVTARNDLDELGIRLSKALGGAPTTGWTDALLPVAHFAATQPSLRFDPGARLLHDLQAACVVAEREDQRVDLVGWAFSKGKKPAVRALPATREVRIAKRLHAASAKIAACGLDNAEQRERLSDVIHAMVRRAEDNLRAVIRPKVEGALDDVGLHPYSLPERVGEKKLVDELLDRAVAVGRLSLGDLRDAISRNDLKLPDLTTTELKSGDPLLRADRILSTSLDGVYRRGEGYLRFLQILSSVLFGTKLGRLFTLYLMLPFLGSFAVVEGLQHTVGLLWKKITHVEPEIATRTTLLGGAALLFLLMHVPIFRRGVILLLRAVGTVIKTILWTAPRAVWRHPVVQRVLDSWLTRWVLKPSVPALITALFVHGFWRWPIAGAVFAVFAVGLNVRFGRLVEEVVADWAVRSGRQFTSRIVPGIIKYTLAFFSKLIELLDRGIYKVDEWLRFRSGQSVIKLAIKGVLGVVWGLVTWILRFYVNLFVEPTINPIKHFPVVTVAAKLIIPFIPTIVGGVSGPAVRLMGPAVGKSFAAFTVLVLPGLAGFLVWELKENWKLYKATRPKALRPLAIGHHGETLSSFLKPGFHSGTIPKLFTKLRRAAWKDDERGVARQNEALHHVEEAIATFVDRQLVSMLNEVSSFHATDVTLGHVEIGSNRVQIAIRCASVSAAPATIRFEQQSGWLVASLATAGWIDALRDDQRQIVEIALAGFYKLSGVDILREQVEAALRDGPVAPPPYDVADDGLVVWPSTRFETEIVYDLRSPKLAPAVRGRGTAEADEDVHVIDLAGRHAIFGREPLYWAVWSTTWRQIAAGEPPGQKIIVGPSLLRRRGDLALAAS